MKVGVTTSVLSFRSRLTTGTYWALTLPSRSPVLLVLSVENFSYVDSLVDAHHRRDILTILFRELRDANVCPLFTSNPYRFDLFSDRFVDFL